VAVSGESQWTIRHDRELQLIVQFQFNPFVERLGLWKRKYCEQQLQRKQQCLRGALATDSNCGAIGPSKIRRELKRDILHDYGLDIRLGFGQFLNLNQSNLGNDFQLDEHEWIFER
jgi:hypothetical protein